jgi:hypothetical protein
MKDTAFFFSNASQQVPNHPFTNPPIRPDLNTRRLPLEPNPTSLDIHRPTQRINKRIHI